MIRRGKWYRNKQHKHLVRVVDVYDWVVVYKRKGRAFFIDLQDFEDNYEQLNLLAVIREFLKL